MESLKLFVSQISSDIFDGLLYNEANFDKMMQFAIICIIVAFLVFLLLMMLMPSKENQSLQEINKTIEGSRKRVERVAVVGCTLKSYKQLNAKQRRRIDKNKTGMLAIVNSFPINEGVPLGQTENPKDGEEITIAGFNKEFSVYKRKGIRRRNTSTNSQAENFFESEYQSNYIHYN